MSSSGKANYCRLVMADGEEVYADQYLLCKSHLPIDEPAIHLVAPPDSFDMWLSAEGENGIIGFLADGNLLLPVNAQGKCDAVNVRLKSRRPTTENTSFLKVISGRGTT